MKVLMISDSFFENLLYQENFLVKAYLKRGIEVSIITSTFDNVKDYYNDNYNTKSRVQVVKNSEYTLVRLPYTINFLNKIRKFSNITNYLRENDPDLIFIHDIQFNIHEVVEFVKHSKKKIKLILDFHADYSNSGKNIISRLVLHKIIKGLYFKRYIKYFDAILPIVPDSMLFLAKLYGVPLNLMKLFPLGVDLEKSIYYLNGQYRNELRKKIGVQDNTLVIFTGGKLEPRKQTEQLMQVVSEFTQSEVHLIIVGDFVSCPGSYISDLKAIIASADNITHTGWLSANQVYEYMSASDLAIFPASQSVLWQQSIGMGLPLLVGKYVNLDDGRCLDQRVEYLNFNENVIVLKNPKNKKQEIKEGIQKFLNPVVLSDYKEKSKYVASELLNYDRLVDITLNIELR